MIYHFLRSRNPLEKFIWAATSALTFIAMMATANRGAILGITVGVVYILILLRKRISLHMYVMILASIVVIFMGTQFALDRYTYATSISDRVMGTTFKQGLPDTRWGAWVPVFTRALDHVFIGHGPYYAAGGATRRAWPHNAYLFYLSTIGLFGLGAFIFIVVRVFKLSLSYRKPIIQNTFLGDIALILHVQLVMSLVEQLRTDHQRADIYIYIIWMFFGLITATAHIIMNKENRQRKEKTAAVETTTSSKPPDS
jgi:O-antigen ligase